MISPRQVGGSCSRSACVAGRSSFFATLMAKYPTGRALKSKQSARGTTVNATADLIAARERFIDLYTGVAKPLVRGLLNELGRTKEFELFFLDLQMNEGSPRKPGEGASGSVPAPVPQTS